MVCVEAFSKHAELVPIRDKSAPEVAYAFLHSVLGLCMVAVHGNVVYTVPEVRRTKTLIGTIHSPAVLHF